MHRLPTTFQVDGTAIRKRRKELGLGRNECANEAGISGPYLTQLETGARRDMRPPTYARLRTVLRVPADDARLLAPSGVPQREEPDGRHEGAARQDDA